MDNLTALEKRIEALERAQHGLSLTIERISSRMTGAAWAIGILLGITLAVMGYAANQVLDTVHKNQENIAVLHKAVSSNQAKLIERSERFKHIEGAIHSLDGKVSSLLLMMGSRDSRTSTTLRETN